MSGEVSEALTSLFGLRAAEGESLQVWISPAGEIFESSAEVQGELA